MARVTIEVTVTARWWLPFLYDLAYIYVYFDLVEAEGAAHFVARHGFKYQIPGYRTKFQRKLRKLASLFPR